jgi:hypothetical protein
MLKHSMVFCLQKRNMPFYQKRKWIQYRIDNVNGLKQFHRRSFWIITLFMLVAAAGAGAGILWSLDRVSVMFGAMPDKTLAVERISLFIELLRAGFMKWVVPAVAGILLLFGWILWLVLRMGTAGIARDKDTGKMSEPPAAGPGKKDFLDQKIEQERKQRLFLHTLSVLQREGRLLDFFDEDLKQYSDEQIGAAVRSIQADCKQAVKKYIDPRPVLAGNEGDAITVEPGFDMNAMNLVGDVAGDPPFEGIIRHPGWKAGKKEIPRLSDIRDSSIITPAEIEVRARN